MKKDFATILLAVATIMQTVNLFMFNVVFDRMQGIESNLHDHETNPTIHQTK